MLLVVGVVALFPVVAAAVAAPFAPGGFFDENGAGVWLWMLLVSVPVGAGLLVVWGGALLVARILRRRSR